MKKIKFNQILDLVFWSIIIIMTFIELYNGGLKNINISDFQIINFQEITAPQYITIVLSIFFVILVSAIFSMFRVFYLTIIYFGIKIANKKYNKERIEKVDLKNDNYYRDILPKYSPAVLSYVDDFKINKEDIVATLLMLELKGKIKIKDDSIVLLDDTIENLEENEIYILNKVKENNLKDINILEYASIVRNDALKKGLLQEKQGVKKNIKRRIIINIIIYLFVLIVFSMIPNFLVIASDSATMILGFILLMILFAFLVFMPYSTIVYISHYKMLNTLDPYIRNDEGKMINLKLEGLRKYLVDFSKIEEKTKEQLILWEEYLVYSVILGINTKVIEEVYNKIK
ncbi:MAG: DUF2207 domain-containing protein [Clostridia bacterium]|nr:DUF2207 domain-containing protein [Clostridia bacterium]